ncbi:hypothetical protein KI387_010829 [Taxus chinensis]|uniref:Transmembrane protein n=1 Tax=Taxus chinensis TaxID=29808 RepID=A0AA38KW68_TAXCH|nr:hypothetical protein KI387_010829 [Taxus chinensis]
MARWVGMAVLGGGSAAGNFLAVVACVLAVATVAVALCATHFRREDKSRKTSNRSSSSGSGSGGSMDLNSFGDFKLPPKSPGRAILDTLSSKTLFVGRKWRRGEEEELKAYDRAAMEEGDFLWQRSILMGERCQPPDFSGMIIYDHMGNRLPEFPPKSPRRNLLQVDAQHE